MESLIYGMIFGLVNGLSPGPTLTMVVTQTLQYNLKEGIKIALAPIFFGLIIIPVSVLMLDQLTLMNGMMLSISIIGAIYLAYLGYQLIISPEINVNAPGKASSFSKGMLINFTSPFAYLFWFTVGGPFVVRTTHHIGINSAIIFIMSYYLFLVGSKMIIAIMVNKSKVFLDKKYYSSILRLLGAVLIVFSLLILKQAFLYWM